MELTVISTFAGCGGSSLGYKMAGFKELLAIDWENNAVVTFKLNFPDIPIWQKDIKDVKVNDILKFCKIKKGELDVLDGSPPCQGFSTSGKRNVNDDRNDLFKEYVRLLKGLKPKVFVMENVSGMAKSKMKGKFIEILKELKSIGYNVKCKQMNAKYYKVAQSWERLIFIGIRKNLKIEPSFPIANKNIITVKQVLKNIQNKEIVKPLGEIDKHYADIRIGSDLAEIFVKKTGRRKYFNVIKINPDKPLNTITKLFSAGISGLLHWEEKRFLTVEELKRCSSFPDEFIFVGTFKEQWACIGNAVMPNMMKAIAEHIRDNILGIK